MVFAGLRGYEVYLRSLYRKRRGLKKTHPEGVQREEFGEKRNLQSGLKGIQC